jgi:hypothetical protein
MLNVIAFRNGASRSHRSTRARRPENTAADISELASSIDNLQSRAKDEIAHAILMLDLAAQHAREIESRLSDPAAKRSFDEHISIIEQLLELARAMTFRL